MREIKGDLWSYLGRAILCITTNGRVRKDGHAIMGRGCARQTALRMPAITRDLGRLIKDNGNIFQLIYPGIYSFPVKHSWEMDANSQLILESAKGLDQLARANPKMTYICGRPGCGNGKLTWAEVKPIIEFLPDNVLVIDYDNNGKPATGSTRKSVPIPKGW